MHRDQKIGLSLAVLLIGFAAAFCFRHEPLPEPSLLTLERTEELDMRIEHLPIRAYTERESAARSKTITTEPEIVAADGPLSNVIDASSNGRTQEIKDGTPVGNRIGLFAGPPEPLRVVDVHAGPPGIDTSPTPLQTSAWSGVSQQQIRHEKESQPKEVQPLPSVDESVATSSDTPNNLPTIDYVVQPGETLSELALRFLGNTNRYHELFEMNRHVLANPHSLRAGTVIHVPAPKTQ